MKFTSWDNFQHADIRVKRL